MSKPLLDLVIRAESPSLCGEKRVACIPENLRGYDYAIEPSLQRILPLMAYPAIRWDDAFIKEPTLIVGVKPFEPELVFLGQTHACFAHVIKGQRENMPLLRAFIDQGASLFDYECIRSPVTGKRLLGFGFFAGVAGTVEGLLGLNQLRSLRGEPEAVPGLKKRINFKSSLDAILENSSPNDLKVLIIGTGKVANGARDVCELLGLEEISAFELGNANVPSFSQVSVQDVIKRTQGGEVDYEEYKEYGAECYKGNLLPLLKGVSLVVYGAYWDEKYPKLLTREDIAKLIEAGSAPEMIADVTCDPGGSFECTTHESTLDNPFYTYFPKSEICEQGVSERKDGLPVMAVSNLPTVFPLDASRGFSMDLAPFLPELVEFGKGLVSPDNLSPELLGALIVYKGELMEKYKYLEKYL